MTNPEGTLRDEQVLSRHELIVFIEMKIRDTPPQGTLNNYYRTILRALLETSGEPVAIMYRSVKGGDWYFRRGADLASPLSAFENIPLYATSTVQPSEGTEPVGWLNRWRPTGLAHWSTWCFTKDERDRPIWLLTDEEFEQHPVSFVVDPDAGDARLEPVTRLKGNVEFQQHMRSTEPGEKPEGECSKGSGTRCPMHGDCRCGWSTGEDCPMHGADGYVKCDEPTQDAGREEHLGWSTSGR